MRKKIKINGMFSKRNDSRKSVLGVSSNREDPQQGSVLGVHQSHVVVIVQDKEVVSQLWMPSQLENLVFEKTMHLNSLRDYHPGPATIPKHSI